MGQPINRTECLPVTIAKILPFLLLPLLLSRKTLSPPVNWNPGCVQSLMHEVQHLKDLLALFRAATARQLANSRQDATTRSASTDTARCVPNCFLARQFEFNADIFLRINGLAVQQGRYEAPLANRRERSGNERGRATQFS